MAITRWLGGAVDIADAWTVTMSGTWVNGDTITTTINNKQFIVTVGDDITNDEVALLYQQAFEGATLTDTTASSSPTVETGGARSIGEYAELEATVSGAVVTLRAVFPGVPVTITSVTQVSTAGVATLAHPTTATGRHFFSNATNWSEGSVPGAADDIIYDYGEISCLYDLDRTGTTPTSLTVKAGFIGTIGLPERNEENSAATYDEYRDKSLEFSGITTVTIGDGIGEGSGRIRLKLGSSATTVEVNRTNARINDAIPSLLIDGNSGIGTVLNLNRGDVGVAFFAGQSCHLSVVRVGYVVNPDGDSLLAIAPGCDVVDADFTIAAGNTSINSATSSGTIEVKGGTVRIMEGAHASIVIDDGTVFYESTGTITSAIVGGDGIIDFSRDLRPRTVSACEVHGDGSFLDSYGTVTKTTGIDLVRTSLVRANIDVGTHFTLGTSSI